MSGGTLGRMRVSARRLRPVVRALGRRAGLLAPCTHTELVIDVSCAAPLLAGWTARHHQMAEEHHLTLLDPFVPSYRLDRAVLRGVQEVLAEFEPFSYELVRLQRFPRVLYLSPEPAEPFIAITEALWRRFPDHPPYGGAFDIVVPHVTLVLGDEPVGLADFVAQRLPVSGRVDDVELRMEDATGRWGVAERFVLGMQV
jgi:2'-5' RNA ligase